MVFILCLMLLMVGLFGALSQKNLIKVVISVAIVEYAVNLFLVLVGYRSGGGAPIRAAAVEAGFTAGAVDPFPQAMVLTAIVIGVGVLGLALALAIQVYRHHGTLDVTEIKGLKW